MKTNQWLIQHLTCFRYWFLVFSSALFQLSASSSLHSCVCVCTCTMRNSSEAHHHAPHIHAQEIHTKRCTKNKNGNMLGRVCGRDVVGCVPSESGAIAIPQNNCIPLRPIPEGTPSMLRRCVCRCVCARSLQT